MSDNANSNIKQVLTSFDNFLVLLENPVWVKSAKIEEIKSAFKLGRLVEKTMAHFRSRNSLPEFMNMLIKWRKTKDQSKVYSENNFQLACDHLLLQFLKCENIMETTLDIIIRIYTSILPRDRLLQILTRAISLSTSYEAITDFAGIIMSSNETKDLEYHLKLTNWSNLMKNNQENAINIEIDNNLSVYKLESNLDLLIGILNLSGVSEHEELVQNIILENILQRMSDRSVLSNKFWLTLFKQVEMRCICNTCNNFKEFLISLFNFIVYITSMMIENNNMWKIDTSVSICPQISYHDILAFIKNIYNVTTLKHYVIDRLNDAREYTNSCIWDKIKEELYYDTFIIVLSPNM